MAAPDQNGPSLQELAKIDRAAAEQAALKAVPGTVLETELEEADNGYMIYDVEVAGDDGKTHDAKVDAGNGEILHRGLKSRSTKPTGLVIPKTLMGQAILKTLIEECPRACGESRDG